MQSDAELQQSSTKMARPVCAADQEVRAQLVRAVFFGRAAGGGSAEEDGGGQTGRRSADEELLVCTVRTFVEVASRCDKKVRFALQANPLLIGLVLKVGRLLVCDCWSWREAGLVATTGLEAEEEGEGEEWMLNTHAFQQMGDFVSGLRMLTRYMQRVLLQSWAAGAVVCGGKISWEGYWGRKSVRDDREHRRGTSTSQRA